MSKQDLLDSLRDVENSLREHQAKYDGSRDEFLNSPNWDEEKSARRTRSYNEFRDDLMRQRLKILSELDKYK